MSRKKEKKERKGKKKNQRNRGTEEQKKGINLISSLKMSITTSPLPSETTLPTSP